MLLKKGARWLITITGVCLFFCSIACADSVIRIGLITDLSGKAAAHGTQSLFGATLAQEELKAQGINVELMVGDHKLDTKTAITEAQRMLAHKDLRALLSDFTPTTVAISAPLKTSRTLLLYQAPSSSIAKENPYAFRDFLDYEEGCKAIAEQWKIRGIKKVGHLKLNMEFGELCLNGAKSIYPKQIVVDYNSGDDLKTALARLRSKGVQAIFQTAYEADMLNRIQINTELNYSPLIGVPEPLVTKTVREKAGPSLNGTYAFGFPTVSPEFVAKVKAKDPEHAMVNIESAAISYMHVKHVAAMAPKCLLDESGCEVVELGKLKGDSALGFEGWVERSAKYPLVVKSYSDGTLQ